MQLTSLTGRLTIILYCGASFGFVKFDIDIG